MRRSGLALVVVAVASTHAVAARAEDARAAARALAEQGDGFFGQGRCDKAIQLWEEADRTFHAPTIELRIARCQAILGRVVAATKTLEAILAERLSPDAPAPFVDAYEQAKRDLIDARARVATLKIEVSDGGAALVPVIEIDGVAGLPGQSSFAVDPGRHLVRVRVPELVWERVVSLDEGGSRSYQVPLVVETPSALSRNPRTVGYAVGGVGVAALSVGTGLWVSALTSSKALDAPPAIAANVTLVSGAALFAAGLTLVLTAPASSSSTRRVRVLATANYLSVDGSF